MQISRDSHYVPQFYLRQWSSDGKRAHCHKTIARNGSEKRWRLTSIRSLCSWKDFYSLEDEEGMPVDAIERYFGDEFESKASAVINHVKDGLVISDEEARCLVDFALIQMVRTPAWYMKIHEISLSAAPKAMSDIIGVLAEVDDYSQLNHFLGPIDERRIPRPPFPNYEFDVHIDAASREIETTYKVGRHNYLASISSIIKGETGQAFRQQRWAICEMPDGVELPTSDNPVVRLAFYKDGNVSLDAPIGLKGAIIFMPLTPRHLLICEVGVPEANLEGIVAVPGVTDILIEAMVKNAVMYVICSKTDSAIERIRPREISPDFVKCYEHLLKHWDELQ